MRLLGTMPAWKEKDQNYPSSCCDMVSDWIGGFCPVDFKDLVPCALSSADDLEIGEKSI